MKSSPPLSQACGKRKALKDIESNKTGTNNWICSTGTVVEVVVVVTMLDTWLTMAIAVACVPWLSEAARIATVAVPPLADQMGKRTTCA